MSAAVLKLEPHIGRPWAGGIFAGAIGNYQLIVGAQLDGKADWAAAMAFARSLNTSGCADFTLPTVAELALLDSTFPRLLRRKVYWTCATHPDLPSDALVVHFGAGLVIHWGKTYCAHAIAVRRVSTSQEFSR